MLLFCLITLTSASLAFSSELCVSQTPCRCVTSENKVLDISSVGSPEYPRFYQVEFTDECNFTALYSYNPCYSFDSSDKHTVVGEGHKPCTGAAACIRIPGGPDGELPEEYAIGLQSSAKFQILGTENIIHYTVPGSKGNLIVKLICNETAQESALLELEKEKKSPQECPKGPNTVLKLTSKCACVDGCSSAISPETPSSGLSVGSKILIAFFTILLAYFIVGIFWNFCNGSQGVELIPNLEFWNGLPTLVMEGIVFTCSCCGKKSSYGEV